MTIKEAIEWIEKYRSDWEHECKSHHPMKEALQMAIAALEKQEQYAKAEAEGRLIVLPCKVGDTVWYLAGIRRNIIKSATVEGITIDCNGICDIHVKNEDGVEFWHEFDIFHLTREAAEAALKEAQE